MPGKDLEASIQSMIHRLEDKIDQRLDKVDNRLEKMDDKIDAVSKTTDRNTIVLEEHQRRALANEKHAQLLEEQIKDDRLANAASVALAVARKIELDDTVEQQNEKIKELSDSTEFFVKFPKLLKKASKIAASFGGILTFLWGLIRFASRHM